MLYMVSERFKEGTAPEVYRRAREKVRMIPDGLEYVSSWVDLEFTTCYQLMRTDDASLFAVWTNAWKDLVEFEIVPVRTCGGSPDYCSTVVTSAQRAGAMPHFSLHRTASGSRGSHR